MTEAVVAALITGGVSLLGTVITVIISSSKTSALLAYRLEQLERKQDRHNRVIERTYALEERAHVLEVKMNVADHRIDDLERLNGGTEA